MYSLFYNSISVVTFADSVSHLSLYSTRPRLFKCLQVLHDSAICTVPQVISIVATRNSFPDLGLDRLDLRKLVIRVGQREEFAADGDSFSLLGCSVGAELRLYGVVGRLLAGARLKIALGVGK